MKKVVHLFASQRVNRKARTDNEEVFREKVTLITNKEMSIGQLADFSQLVKDMGNCGIVIGDGKVVLKGDQIKVLNGNDEAAMFEGGKLNAKLIDAETITMNHLYAKSADDGTIVGHFGNYDKADAVVGSDKCPLWLGAALAKDAPFRVTKDGSLYASKGIFAGELKGVTGSFYRLTAVSSDGNESAGSIYLSSSGRMTFEGDILHQGYKSTEERGWRFYASIVWCRVAFGHLQSTLAVVSGDVMQVYPDGYGSKSIPVSLERVSYDNKTVYKIPLYSPNENLSGCPIDIVVFRTLESFATYYYEFVPVGTGKRWMAINANDSNNGIYFCDVGGWHQLHGGKTINLVYISPDLLIPSQKYKTYFGCGIFWSGENDLDWLDRKN